MIKYIKAENDYLFLSFNGGKDATIVLYLTFIAMQILSFNPVKAIKVVYFVEPDSLPECDKFIEDTKKGLNF